MDRSLHRLAPGSLTVESTIGHPYPDNNQGSPSVSGGQWISGITRSASARADALNNLQNLF